VLLVFVEQNIITLGNFIQVQKPQTMVDQLIDCMKRQSPALDKILHLILERFGKVPHVNQILAEIRKWKSNEEKRDDYMQLYGKILEIVTSMDDEFKTMFGKIENTHLLTIQSNEPYIQRNLHFKIIIHWF
jgi:hypothetical protein